MDWKEICVSSGHGPSQTIHGSAFEHLGLPARFCLEIYLQVHCEVALVMKRDWCQEECQVVEGVCVEGHDAIRPIESFLLNPFDRIDSKFSNNLFLSHDLFDLVNFLTWEACRESKYIASIW